MLRSIAATILLLVYSLSSMAQDYDAGLKAIKSGDFATALENWKPLAEQGNVNAQHDLAIMYYFGEGVQKDRAEAARWYRLAAEQGHAAAQFTLGVLYALGDGVQKDDAEAARWYRLAAEQGVAKAQFNLGYAYFGGKGVRSNYAEAERWWILAAKQEDADAQVNLGVLYASKAGNRDNASKGVEAAVQEYEKAIFWTGKAAAQGNKRALELLPILEKGRADAKKVADVEHKKGRYEKKSRESSGYPSNEDLRAAMQKLASVRGLNVLKLTINNCYLKKDGRTYLCNITTDYTATNPLSGAVVGLLNMANTVWFDFAKGSNGWHHVKTYASCKIRDNQANCKAQK